MKKKIKKNNENIKLFRLLNDEIFWLKFKHICISRSLWQIMSRNKKLKITPTRKTLNNFIEEYKFITGDARDNEVIKLELLSEE